MVQTSQLIVEISPVAVLLMVDVPCSAVPAGATGAVLWWWTSLCSRSDKFQQLIVLDGPQIQSPTFLSSASEGILLQKCSIFRPPSIWTLRPKWRGRREFDSQAFCHLNRGRGQRLSRMGDPRRQLESQLECLPWCWWPCRRLTRGWVRQFSPSSSNRLCWSRRRRRRRRRGRIKSFRRCSRD